jgi:hypothetical protein
MKEQFEIRPHALYSAFRPPFLGSGATGYVYRALDKSTNAYVALKVVPRFEHFQILQMQFHRFQAAR